LFHGGGVAEQAFDGKDPGVGPVRSGR
jgi:hypothetical protein